ncbi:hypothetical protein RM530_03810 [Algiphilus sp. W345]|uniref:Transcriptional regulator n=1 Tax=Banduia mediterranea TaxID=3075609 RepID=A0ABU2WF39_9GAMM|nr:hypothetical protein [Algiphilus sp. W345]MDT0496491.1 hypothetical protein [Algiphilus sp. W345]
MSTQWLDTAVAAWGEGMPDWVRVLATQCDASSQSTVAKALGYSGGIVGPVLRRTYTAGYDAVEARVRGAFLAATVSCPVLGEMALHVCLQHQRSQFAATNPTRVRLYRACRGGCPHSRLGRDRSEP